jgi:ribosomal protein S18 acetylase RimI-like enzyme
VNAEIRPARDADAADFIAIVAACWQEYPGCVVDIDGEASELHGLASAMQARGGAAWAATAQGRVVGLVAAWPTSGLDWEVGKMYVIATSRGTGAATSLLGAAEHHARQAGATRLRLWSDTRFARAHAFYERHGFLRDGPIRALADRSNSIEFGYAKPLAGLVVRRPDVAAAASAERALATLLIACVAEGAAVSFLPPVAPAAARAFWRRITTGVAAGTHILLVAWLDGMVCGTVTVNADTPPNQPHRADVQKLMVAPEARRRGVARALMQAAEREAGAAGRDLLVLDTRENDAGEGLYRSLGYTEAGRIPGYALNPDGSRHATVLFYKSVA